NGPPSPTPFGMDPSSRGISSRPSTSPAIAHGADQRLHVIEVAEEGAAPELGDPELRPRQPPLEALRAIHVPCLLELPGMNAQIPVRGPDERLELVEGERLVHRERAEDGEAKPLVDEPVDLGRSRLARERLCGPGPSAFALRAAGTPLLGAAGLSHRSASRWRSRMRCGARRSPP